MVFCMFSCGDDADDCIQADWVGTYSGTIDCDGTVEDVTVTVTASGDTDVIISYEQDVFTTEFDALTPDGCSVEQSATALGATFSFDADLDGTTFTAEDKTTFEDPLLSDIICKINATKN